MRDCGEDVPLAKLPGGDLVSAGIEALRRGEFTVEALARLRRRTAAAPCGSPQCRRPRPAQ